jgi:hypothetical protein
MYAFDFKSGPQTFLFTSRKLHTKTLETAQDKVLYRNKPINRKEGLNGGGPLR